MSTPSVASGVFFIQTRRYKEAEETLRQVIAANPQNSYAHAMLALALMGQERTTEALREAEQGIHLDPNSADAYYIHAEVLIHAEQVDLALREIEQAIRLNPEVSNYYLVPGRVLAAKRDFNQALKAVDQGLALDPENVQLINLRSIILIQMGRRVEAGATIRQALSRDPENPMTHATQGWALLNQLKPEEALVHFREALSLNPTLQLAQDGIVEAMKARNPIYRQLLRYTLTMLRLPPRTRNLIMIGGFIGAQLVNSTMRRSPELAPILVPIFIAYLIFVVLSWTGSPLFDLLLRFDRFGRMALPRENIIASNGIALCILAALALLGIGFTYEGSQRSDFHIAALQAIGMMIPVAGLFHFRHSKNRNLFLGLTALAALLLILRVVTVATGDTEASGALLSYFVLTIVGYTWLPMFIRN